MFAAGLLTPNQSVTISFDARGSYGVGGVAFAELFSDILGGGVSKTELLGGAPLNINSDSAVWTNFSFTTTLGSDVSGGLTLQLGATNGAVPNETTTMYYDNVVIDAATTVPEPATAGLLLGVSVLGLTVRRRHPSC